MGCSQNFELSTSFPQFVDKYYVNSFLSVGTAPNIFLDSLKRHAYNIGDIFFTYITVHRSLSLLKG